MEILQTLLFVLQVLVAVALIGFILIQHGKGADAGAAFGSGSSSTVFGSQGSGGFMVKVTTVLAVVFLVNSLTLGYLAIQQIKNAPSSLLDQPGLDLREPLVQDDIPSITDDAVATDSDLPAIPVE